MTLRVGVIGVGHLGKHHARILSSLPGVELAAVVDINQARAKEIAAAHGTMPLFDARDLTGRVDAVTIAVPTEAHRDVALPFLDAGVGVLVEKPMARSLDEADALIAASAKAGATLAVGHTERFNPAVAAARPLLRDPRFIEVHRLGTFPERSLDIDVVFDLMIHDLDVVLSLVKSDVASIDAVGVPVLTGRVDIANARLRFANGCIANITASRVSMKRERKLRIFQADAYLAVDYGERRVLICRREPDGDGQAALTLEDREVPEGDALEAEIDAFLRAVRAREAPAVTGWDGLRALEVAHIIRESLETEVRAVQAAPGP